jgi:hypothetical protein
LNGEVDFGKIFGLKFESIECLVGIGSLGLVFGFQLLRKATSAVLTGTTSLGLWFAFSSYSGVSVSECPSEYAFTHES